MVKKEFIDTRKNFENFVKLVEGVAPSEIGLTISEAFILLVAVVARITRHLECDTDWHSSESRSALLEYLDKVRDLAKFFKEAAYLTKEL